VSILALTPVPQTLAQETSIERATLAESGSKTAEISTEQLRRILVDKSAIIIDTRSQTEFDVGHIPGAIALDVTAADQITAVERLVSGDKTKALVLYCNGPFCQASRRLGDQLAQAGHSDVRRYQLGMPVWRALGGPTVVELGGLKRIAEGDQLAVFIDARPADDFAKGSLLRARNAPIADVLSGSLKKIDLPEDDFNRRIVLFARDGAEARKLADFMAKRPWHNVMYFPGSFSDLATGLKGK